MDGDVHYSGKVVEKDYKRTEFLNKNGIIVLRFDNDAVLHRAEAVVESIESYIKEK